MSPLENGGGSPLDLNNLPEGFTGDVKHPSEDTSSSGSGQRNQESEREESGKVYECRFCSLKFCKSQALGGHMNRHRQERETESLNKARQLVFGTENLVPYASFPPHHLQAAGGGYHHHQGTVMYPGRVVSTASGSPRAPPPPTSHTPPPLYTSRPPLMPYGSHYPPAHHHHDYLHSETSNYTFVGAPLAASLGGNAARGFLLNSSGTTSTWGGPDTSYTHINPFQDSAGF